jgi:hypothetical protein
VETSGCGTGSGLEAASTAGSSAGDSMSITLRKLELKTSL